MKSHLITRAALPCILAVLGLNAGAAEAPAKPDIPKQVQALAGLCSEVSPLARKVAKAGDEIVLHDGRYEDH